MPGLLTMRLWSLHPKFLDAKGLVALWREALLAKRVLEGGTKGYRNHPQLSRFRNSQDPLSAINAYLCAIAAEANVRGYHFDATKYLPCTVTPAIKVTDGQLRYEWQHLMKKLATRDPDRLHALTRQSPLPHPLFLTVVGPIETWEVTDSPD